MLTSDKRLPADIIVPATGLRLCARGGIKLNVNGIDFLPDEAYVYKSCMFADHPNYFNVFGYLHQSWTLKAALVGEFASRLIRFMDDKRLEVVCPRTRSKADAEWLTDMTSGYLNRGKDQMPRQGAKYPWRMSQNYFHDLWALHISPYLGAFKDSALEYKQFAARDLKM